jgi:hypothetical protein
MRPAMAYPNLSTLDPLSYARMLSLSHPGMPAALSAAAAAAAAAAHPVQHLGARLPAGVFPGLPFFLNAAAAAGAAPPGAHGSSPPGSLPPSGPGGAPPGLHPASFGYFMHGPPPPPPPGPPHGSLSPAAVSYHALNLSSTPTSSSLQSHVRLLIEQQQQQLTAGVRASVMEDGGVDSEGLRKSISIDSLRQRAKEHLSMGGERRPSSTGTSPESPRKASSNSPGSDLSGNNSE